MISNINKGASRGIGAASAILAAKKGYDVCVNYFNNKEAAEKVVNQISKLGKKAISVRADIASEKDVKEMFDITFEKLGYVNGLKQCRNT